MKRARSAYEDEHQTNGVDEHEFNNNDDDDSGNNNMALVEDEQQEYETNNAANDNYNNNNDNDDEQMTYNDSANFNMFAYSADLLFDQSNNNNNNIYNDAELDNLQQEYFQDDYYGTKNTSAASTAKFFEDDEESSAQKTTTPSSADSTAPAATPLAKRDNDVKQSNVWYMSEKRVKLADIPQGLFSQVVANTLTQTLQVNELFAVQRAVVPSIITLHKSRTPGDICVSSPTGSGKTLCYVLPIQEALHKYASSSKSVQLQQQQKLGPQQLLQHFSLSTAQKRKLRAIIIVPTQNLAEQVFELCKKFDAQTGLTTGIAHGSTHPLKEAKKLIQQDFNQQSQQVEYSSAVDVLIATPSRLLYHISSTMGFSMEYLEFLVFDEVDKLLNEENVETVKHILQLYNNTYVEQFVCFFFAFFNMFNWQRCFL